MSIPTSTSPSYSEPRVKLGYWVDHAHNQPFGAIVTLSPRWSQALSNFLTLLIPVIAVRLWHIVAFAIHQSRASLKPRDTLHYQRQICLRNDPDPQTSTINFLLQAWYWRKHSVKAFLRCLGWLALVMAYVACWAILAVFLPLLISQHSRDTRIVSGGSCGYYQPGITENSLDSAMLGQAIDHTSSRSSAAALYAQTCYSTQEDPVVCNKYPVSRLRRSKGVPAACPFATEICLDGYEAWRIDTGVLDSLKDFGINMPSSYRIGYRRIATCALLSNGDGFVNDDFSSDPPRREWLYGFNQILASTFTQYLDSRERLLGGYRVEAYHSRLGWSPISELQTVAADTSIIFVAAQGTLYLEQIDDPLFSAHHDTSTGYWQADNLAQAIACTEEYQICHPESPGYEQRCTSPQGVVGMVEEVRSPRHAFTDQQKATSRRLLFATRMGGSTAHGVAGRGASALQASQHLSSLHGNFQSDLPDDQWQREIDGWFNVSLTLQQDYVQEFASGPQYPSSPNEYLNLTADSTEMCEAQVTRDSAGTVNFSVFGLGMLLGLAVLIIIASYLVERIVGRLQARSESGTYKRRAWAEDNVFHLHRMHLHDAGKLDRGNWENVDGAIPFSKSTARYTRHSCDSSQKSDSSDTPSQ